MVKVFSESFEIGILKRALERKDFQILVNLNLDTVSRPKE